MVTPRLKPPAKSKSTGKNPPPRRKLSHTHQPPEMSLKQWQIELRRQYAQDQSFEIENIGGQKVFSDFKVCNPKTGGTYRVAIRGEGLGESYCSCPDFATNTLGTCKHIEYLLHNIRKTQAGAAALARGFTPEYSSVYLKYGAQREVMFRPGTQCPESLKRASQKFFDESGRLLPGAWTNFDDFVMTAAHIGHDLRCYEDAQAFMAEKRDAARRAYVLRRVFPQGINSSAFNKLLKVPLYPYQREGALFAVRAGRALIGDEMGLGKTIQAIAAAEIMAQHLGVERVLVICPTSLKHQWRNEIHKFSGRSVDVVGGLRARREDHYSSESFFKVTNYDTIRRDWELINKWMPDLVILDEAQRIKNWNTHVARAVKRISSDYAIVLTGTPLENRLEELASLVQFVDRHRLGPTFAFLDRHQQRDEDTGRVIGYQRLDEVGRTLEPILIRRRKSAVLQQLPARMDNNVFVPMTEEQQIHHEENRVIVARLASKWAKQRFLSEADRLRLLVALQNMRMSCDSTYLLDELTNFGFKADEISQLLSEMFETPGTKVVVFSQWLRMHELLVERITNHKWGHVLFHGDVPGDQRGELVDRFNKDPDCRIFLATDAGGVGLNLQHAASVVINVDLPWNPAVLEQRIGRVHRLGQSQPVQVINFVARGTIEEGMLSVLRFKKSLFAGALDGGEPNISFGGSRLKKFMEQVQAATAAVTPDRDSATDVASVGEFTVETVQTGPAAENGDEPPAGELPATGAHLMQLPQVAGAQLQPAANTAAASGAAAPANAADPLAGLLQAGLSLLDQWMKQSAGSGASVGNGSRSDGSRLVQPGHSPTAQLVQHDAETGEPYLKIPVPSKQVIDQALSALAQLVSRYGRK